MPPLSNQRQKKRGLSVWIVGAVGLLGLTPLLAAAEGPYSWIQLVPAGKNAAGLYAARAVARVIVEQENLPCTEKVTIALQDGAVKLATTTRAKPKQGNFAGITVCEAVIPEQHTAQASSATVLLEGKVAATLPVPNLSHGIPVTNIIDIGDTGCRNNDDQPDCDPSKDWPFPTLMDGVAAKYTGNVKTPPLVIHTGDYRLYKPTDEDIWQTDKGGWNPEFFQPAAGLLPRAHWIFVRGNHESCHEDGEAGPGWLYFFDFDIGQRRFCTDLSASANGGEAGFLKPFALDATPAGDPSASTIRLVFLDSAHRTRRKNVFDKEGNVIDLDGYDTAVRFKNNYTNRLNQVSPFLADNVPVWLVTHMPVFVATKEYTEKTYELPLPRDALFDSVLVVGDPAPIEKIPVILSGHLHRAQLVNPQVSEPAVQDVRRPFEYVLGNGGVNMSGKDFDPGWEKEKTKWVRLPGSNEEKWQVISEKWNLQRKKEFGFLTAQVTPLQPSGYQAKFHVVFYDIDDGWLSESFVDCTISSDNPLQLVCPDS